jgi:carboxymethylenebutenolidase
MERMKASDFPPELLDDLDLYVHGNMDRRSFIDRCGKYVVGA